MSAISFVEPSKKVDFHFKKYCFSGVFPYNEIMQRVTSWIYWALLCGILGWAQDAAYGAPKSWDVVKDFWWSGEGEINGKQEESLLAWKGLARPSKPNEWSYGTINCMGGSAEDPYPKQIDGVCAKADREPFVQFTPFKETYFNPSIPLFTYVEEDKTNKTGRAEVGYFGRAWFPLAPGFDGAAAGTVKDPNDDYLWMKPVKGGGDGTEIDGIAAAVKWKAPEGGTYRVVGEWVPGGDGQTPNNAMSLAILSSKGKALMPRKVVDDDGPVQPFDLEVKMNKGQELIFVIGSDGSARGNVVGLKARIETK